MQPHGSKYFHRRPHSPPGPGSQKVKIKLFQNIVVVRIKGNRECSNMVANADRGTINKKHIKPYFDQRPVSDPWVDLGGGVKGKIKLFQNMVMLHTKLKGITGAATCNMVANIMPADPPLPDPGGQKVKIQLFQNMVILHIKLKAITNAVTW